MDINVIDLVNMPVPDSYSIEKYEYNKSIKPIQDLLEEVDKTYSQLYVAAKAHHYLIRNGITHAAIDDFGVSLESFGIELNSNSDLNICLESLSTILTQFWNSLMSLIKRLIEYFRTDAYLSQWTNRNEMYYRKISALIQNRERYFALIKEDKFYNTRIIAIPYATYMQKLNATASLIGKLTMLCNVKYEDFNIRSQFGTELVNLGFTFDTHSLIPPETIGHVAGTLRELQWSPSKVHQCTDILFRRILSVHLQVDRMSYAITRTLEQALKECEAVLKNQIDGDNAQRVDIARRRIFNIRCAKSVIQYCIQMTSVLSVQWIKMVNLYDLSGVKFGQ